VYKRVLRIVLRLKLFEKGIENCSRLKLFEKGIENCSKIKIV